MTKQGIIKGIDHISLHVGNLSKSAEFYGKFLNLKPVKRPNFDFNGAWFAIGDQQQIHLIEGRKGKVDSHNRGNHFAVYTDEIELVLSRLNTLGWTNFKPIKDRIDGYRHFFVIDPDGYYIEIVEK